MDRAAPRAIMYLLEGREGELREMRFWSKVDMRTPQECWEWQASLTTSGYGRFKISSYKTAHASRVALILGSKQEPHGLFALHTCDNPRCCNPAHLYWGTHADNMRDMHQRNRRTSPPQDGFRNRASKLDEAALATIVARLKDGWNNKQIAAVVPITHSTVSLIRLGRAWAEQTAALGWEPKVSTLPHRRSDAA